MILRVINHPYEFDMKNLCITFFPHEKIRLEGEEDPVVVTTRRETDGSFFVSAKVYDVYRETTAKPEPTDEEHLVLSVTLYRLLSGILGFAPPWGVLYGVRPAKLMHRLCAQMGDDAAVAHFQTAFLTQKSKAELAHEVMLHENRSIARSGPKSFSLYVSIPFCPTRCAYCSFVSHSIEKTHKLMTPYVDLLLRELEETAKYAKELGLELATVYFGGATVCTQPECKGQVVYTITSKGMEVDMQFFPNDALPEIPEVGLLFELPPDFENLTYLGAGPEENYIDRCNAAQIGLYNTTVTDLYTDYLKPQECGNRTGVRYATLVGQKKVFSLVAEPVMELNVSHWLPKEIENTWHGKDLPPVTKTVVRCIARQQGVGGYDSWGAHCNEKYKNKTDKTYRLKFQIRF